MSCSFSDKNEDKRYAQSKTEKRSTKRLYNNMGFPRVGTARKFRPEYQKFEALEKKRGNGIH